MLLQLPLFVCRSPSISTLISPVKPLLMIPQENQTQPPLCIVLEKLDMTPDGHFRPSAFIKLTKVFRTSGLLHALPSDELKSLFTLLSFLTPNGDCSPTLSQLAGAMRLSQAKTKARRPGVRAANLPIDPAPRQCAATRP